MQIGDPQPGNIYVWYEELFADAGPRWIKIDSGVTSIWAQQGNFKAKVYNPALCSAYSSPVKVVNDYPLFVNLSASPNPVCPGSLSVIEANISGGSGSYFYEWSNAGYYSENDSVYPESTTTYYMYVYDNVTSIVDSITVTTLPSPSSHILHL